VREGVAEEVGEVDGLTVLEVFGGEGGGGEVAVLGGGEGPEG